MNTWMSGLFRDRRPKGHRSSRRPRFLVESLECRQVPTVTFGGGAVLSRVEVQGVYLGADWLNNSANYQETGTLDGFLKTTVNSSYLDALTNAGYNVGRGTASPGVVVPVTLNKSTFLTDAAIQGDLLSSLNNGGLQKPDANRLYVVFVEPNVAVLRSDGSNSQPGAGNFLGYHSAFGVRTANGQTVDVRYAVVAFPGGSANNGAISGVSTTDDLTAVASHELAEAVTDPDINYKKGGWYDNQLNGENGDITAGQLAYLNGYAIQRIADRQDQAITPAGATAFRPVSFVLQTNGNLFEHTSAGFTFLAGGIARVSNQGIDNLGRAMIDAVTTDGRAFEIHDGQTSAVFLAAGVKDAEAGQGFSYVLLNNGALYGFKDATGQSTYLGNGVVSIDAGTDRYGVSSVDLVTTSGNAYEVSEILLQNGNAYDYREATNTATFLGSNVFQVAAGADAAGNAMIELIDTGGALHEYRAGSGWSTIATGARSVSKARAGLTDVLLANGNAYEHTAAGAAFLAGAVAQAV